MTLLQSGGLGHWSSPLKDICQSARILCLTQYGLCSLGYSYFIRTTSVITATYVWVLDLWVWDYQVCGEGNQMVGGDKTEKKKCEGKIQQVQLRSRRYRKKKEMWDEVNFREDRDKEESHKQIFRSHLSKESAPFLIVSPCGCTSLFHREWDRGTYLIASEECFWDPTHNNHSNEKYLIYCIIKTLQTSTTQASMQRDTQWHHTRTHSWPKSVWCRAEKLWFPLTTVLSHTVIE